MKVEKLYTDGEWEAHGNGIFPKGKYTSIAITTRRSFNLNPKGGYEDCEEQQANTNLISQAPAMADLLIEEYKETLGYMKLAGEFEDGRGFLEHKAKADKILSVLTAAGIKITEV